MTTLAQLMQNVADNSSLPLYQQLQRALRAAIDQHLFGPEEALPAERQLAADLSVSRITVRKAIDGLVDEGLLVRRPGSGNFINTRIEKNFAKLTSFSEDMRARGRNPRSVWLKRSEGTVSPEEALRLRLSPGTPVYRFNRIRYADDVPGIRDHRRILPAIAGRGAGVDVRRAGAGRQPAGARLAATQRAAAQRRAGHAAAGARRRRRPAG